MTRVQVLLDKAELSALRKHARASGKSCSRLVREAIDSMYIARHSEDEIARLAGEARRGKGMKKHSDANAFLRHLWSL